MGLILCWSNANTAFISVIASGSERFNVKKYQTKPLGPFPVKTYMDNVTVAFIHREQTASAYNVRNTTGVLPTRAPSPSYPTISYQDVTRTTFDTLDHNTLLCKLGYL